MTLEVGIDLNPLLLLGGEERLEVVEDVVVSPLKPVERLLTVTEKMAESARRN